MRNMIIKILSVFLTMTMLLGVMPASVFAEEAVRIEINDVNNNVVTITSPAEKQAYVVLASYKGKRIVNIEASYKTLNEGTNDYTIEGFEKGAGDIVKAYVWEKSETRFAPLCKSFEKAQLSASGTVEVGSNKLYVYARFFASVLNAVKNIRVAIEPLQKSMSEYSKRMEEYKKTIVDVSAYDQLVAVGNNFAHAAADLNKSLNMEGISKQFIDISKY